MRTQWGWFLASPTILSLVSLEEESTKAYTEAQRPDKNSDISRHIDERLDTKNCHDRAKVNWEGREKAYQHRTSHAASCYGAQEADDGAGDCSRHDVEEQEGR